jgi:hypothetical protein
MDKSQARTEAFQKQIINKMDAHQDRMGASMNAWRKETTACQEATEACLESKEPTSVETESAAVHEEVPKEEAAVKTVRTEEETWGPASSCRASPTADQTDPGRWQVPEEVTCSPPRDDPPCHSCTTQGTRSSGRYLERTDVREEMSGATGMQQRHKKTMPKKRLRRILNNTFRQTAELDILKKIRENKNQGRPPPKRKKRLHTELTAGDVGAVTILGSFACFEQKRGMMVIHVDRLAPYHGAVRNKLP